MLTVKKSPIHGKGLFATKYIPWGTKIMYYTGVVISNKEADKRMRNGARYIFELSDTLCIDGEEGGNDARFINHSRSKANCFILRDEGKIWVVAGIEGIKKGEELLYDYGSEYYPRTQRTH